MPIEEAELLLAVGGIVGRIEVDGNAPGATPEPRAKLLDDEVGQPGARQVDCLPPHGVLEPGGRRLGRQVGTGERIALEQEFVHRVLGQARDVVAVGVAAGDPVDALPHQFDQRVVDLARLPRIAQAARQPLGHPQPVIHSLEQQGPTIRAGVGLIESGHDQLPKPLELEADLQYTGYSHRASSCVGGEASRHRFYSTDERLGGCFPSWFTHNPG